jgi:hypothetical protein
LGKRLAISPRKTLHVFSKLEEWEAKARHRAEKKKMMMMMMMMMMMI